MLSYPTRRRLSWPSDASMPQAAPLLPPASTAWADPNSVLQSVAVAGNQVTLTMRNPAASRTLPTTGASTVFALRDLFGNLTGSVDTAAILLPFLRFSSDTAVPADCWVGLTFINAATVAGATIGSGLQCRGNGTGIAPGYHYYSAGWTAGASAVFATGVRSAQRRYMGNSTNASSISGHQTMTSNAAGGWISTSGETVARTLFPVTHIALCCGWVAGTGSTGATIVFRPYIAASLPTQFPGVL